MVFAKLLAPLWKTTLARWLGVMEEDTVTIEFPDGDKRSSKGQGKTPVSVIIRDWSVIPGFVFGGQMNLAEDFLDGKWSCDHLASLMEIGARHEHLAPQYSFVSAFKKFRNKLWHRGHANTLDGSKKNIAYHYDLGNEFYSQWLDDSMTYSSAMFADKENSLSHAQGAKYERLAKSIDLGPGDRVLEIGCGWGGFAEFAARAYGCHITCLTLSKEQAGFAERRLEEAGLSHLVDIRLEDYREVEGEFDKIVSIEMFEAVGEENWSTYFKTLFDHLAPKGKAALQIITMNEEGFERYRRQVDFIQRYIFPGGMLPSFSALKAHVAREGLALKDTLFFGASYAQTLHIWRDKFLQAWPKISTQGFDQRFRRMWTFYLAYCEGGFRAGKINVGQFIIEKPATAS